MEKSAKLLLALLFVIPVPLILWTPITNAQSFTPTPFVTPRLEATLLPLAFSTQGALFGASVGVSNTSWFNVAVGAPNLGSATGAVYVFENYNFTTWRMNAFLTLPDGVPGDKFGWSVAIDKNTLVVGAPGAYGQMGAAYVYTYDNAVWTYQAEITAPDAAQGSQFGFSVSVSGNTVLIGAPYDDQDNYTDIGSAYVFTGSGATWALQQQLGSYYTPPFIFDGGHFGYSVDIYGDQAVVGAPASPAGATTGFAYPYNRVSSRWYMSFPLVGPLDEQFGASVAIYHDMIVVGSPLYDGAGGANSGRIHVYKWVTSSYVEQLSSDYDAFGGGHQGGFAVDIYRDVQLVGAPFATAGPGGSAAGSALLFQPLPLVIPGTFVSADARFGHAVAKWGNTIVIGSPNDNTGGMVEPLGSVYVYTVPGPPWATATSTPASFWPTSTFVVPTLTPSQTPSPGHSPTPTPSRTPFSLPTLTFTASTTSTLIPSLTLTPTPSPTPTLIPAPTSSPTYTSTPPTPTSPPGIAPSRDFFTTQTPTLSWGRISWAVGYELQISRNTTFTNLIPVSNPLLPDTLSYTTTISLTNGTYYWRVRAIRSNGTVGNWSKIGSFVISAVSP